VPPIGVAVGVLKSRYERSTDDERQLIIDHRLIAPVFSICQHNIARLFIRNMRTPPRPWPKGPKIEAEIQGSVGVLEPPSAWESGGDL